MNQSTGETYFLAKKDRISESTMVTTGKSKYDNVGITLDALKIAIYRNRGLTNELEKGIANDIEYIILWGIRKIRFDNINRNRMNYFPNIY